MKRSVAIYGPTPQFVRWTISHPCPLRELEVDRLADSTFRQLRSLREYSAGLIENRVFENVCIHPASKSTDVDSVRGFHANEVLEAHGDQETVANCCVGCPANAISQTRPGIWAGCYGWLPATSGFCLESILRTPLNLETSTRRDDPNANKALPTGQLDFVKILDLAIEQTGVAAAEELFMKTTPRWYGLWKNPILRPQQVKFLSRVFDAAIALCHGELADGELAELTDLIQFRDALRRTEEHGLTLHIDLVPRGDSNGQTWTLSAHCPDCKSALSESGQQTCLVCGRTGNPHGQQKSKVLGLRPYVNLVGVMGAAETFKFMKRYEARSLKRDL